MNFSHDLVHWSGTINLRLEYFNSWSFDDLIDLVFGVIQSSTFGVVQCILWKGSASCLGVRSYICRWFNISLYLFTYFLGGEKGFRLHESWNFTLVWLQVQQYHYPYYWHNCIYFCNCWCAASDGNPKCIPPRVEASLGGVPE